MTQPYSSTNILTVITHEDCDITHKLMKFSPSSEAANCAATQELPTTLWHQKVHYRLHNSPPLVPILSHTTPIQSIPSHPISLRSTLICQSTYFLIFSIVSFLLAFPPISYMYSSSPPLVLHALPISSFLT
jgi:hypothetical protein